MMTFNDLLDKFDDQLNPIIVKELRQVVRGKFFWGVLILFLGFQCAVLSLSIADRALTNHSAGAGALNLLFGILFFASFVLIPLYSGFRFARERNEGVDELLFITTITPGAIIRGKFSATMIFILLIYSAFSPFMAMTFFLSGVDLAVTFYALLFGLLLSSFGAMAQICFATLAHGGSSQQFFRGVGLFVQIVMFFSITGISSDMISYGMGRFLGGQDLLPSMLTFVICVAVAIYFLYVASAAVIAPAGANRMFPVRVCAVACWVVSLLLTLYWAITISSGQLFFLWGGLVCFGLTVAVLVAISERDYLSERVAREIPAGHVKKRLAFLFYSGAAGGLAWTGVMLAITLISVHFFYENSGLPGVRGDSIEFAELALVFMGYCLGYGLLASFLRRSFFKNNFDVRNTWVIALLVCAAFAIFPLFIGIFFESNSVLFMLGNPFSITIKDNRFEAMVFSLIIGIVGIFINLPWLFRQAKEFVGVKTDE